MLNTPWEAGLLRGNFEALVGLGGGVIFRGPGNAIANGDLFIRYNFIQPHARLVPYWQLGMGLNASDAARDGSQRIIGRTLEFTLQTELGLRFLVNERWSVELEGAYQHISNADTADRNVGVNALGGLLGATFSL
jgi:lipid A 3-O-deacylase